MTKPSDINMLQLIFDKISNDAAEERKRTQMTLGSLIDTLKRLPSDLHVFGIASPHSYRGYYRDLAFEATGATMPASEALELCRGAMGEVFEGYKGGDYMMGRDTPVWIASYGSGDGMRIMSVDDNGCFDLKPEDL